VSLAILGTNPRAGFATDTIGGIRDRHHLPLKFFIFILLIHKLSIFVQAPQSHHALTADFEASAAANTSSRVDRLQKFGNPSITAES
jgi:hypothetical protein